ncbi:unnamed protein product [Cylindrotheca closterium]|uniref:Endonuclease/exonuclease/phosphatase domain-containing protein n=1 Tax=Cylindrotheca closterium TaxID=2856 RepID=A0AAD2FRS5_9STRA|nr:unnamed protein product [Cylindrotheca closterium]
MISRLLLCSLFLTSVASAVEVSLISQNVWFILTASVPAMDRIPDYIAEFRSGTYDILCLQEVWSGTQTTYPDLLFEGLKEVYPYNVSTEPRPLTGLNLGLDSGLMILSKYPIESFAFHQYGNSSGIDAFSGKGAMTAHIKVPDDDGSTRDLIVSNTHLNAGGPLEIRLNQAREMRNSIDRFLKNLEETEGLDIDKVPVFGLGDFNTDEWNDELTEVQEGYQQLLGVLGPTTKDIFRSLYPPDVEVGLTTSSSRIDFVFGLSGEYTVVSAGVDGFVQTANPAFRLSDHLGAHATVKLEPLSANGGASSTESSDSSMFGLCWSTMSLLFLFSSHLMTYA